MNALDFKPTPQTVEYVERLVKLGEWPDMAAQCESFALMWKRKPLTDRTKAAAIVDTARYAASLKHELDTLKASIARGEKAVSA